MSIFSDKLTILMKQHDMNDDTLGELVGVNRTTVSRWRTGERSPKMDKLPEIANIFKVDPRVFVGEIPDKDISLIFNQLDPSRKDKVYDFAEYQLDEQNKSKIVEFKRSDTVVDNTLAAHLVNPSKEFTDDQIDGLKAYLDKARDEYFKKYDK